MVALYSLWYSHRRNARRHHVAGFIAAALALFLAAACGDNGSSSTSSADTSSSGAHPGGYPRRPVTLIVPAAAGGGADRQARVFAKALGDRIGKPIVVKDQPGGNTAVGTEAMLNQPADGYTLLWSITNELTYNIETKATTGLNGFAPVAQLAGEPSAVIAASSKFESFKEFASYAKANPGKVTIAGTNATGGQATMGKQLIAKLGIQARYVPYSGSPDLIAAVLGGKVTVGLAGISNVIPQVKAGTVKYLAIDSPDRVSALPNVPTLKEEGADTGTAALSFFWRGLVVKKGTNPAIVNYLSREANDIVSSDAGWKSYSKANDQIAGYQNPANFRKSLQAALDGWKQTGRS